MRAHTVPEENRKRRVCRYGDGRRNCSDQLSAIEIKILRIILSTREKTVRKMDKGENDVSNGEERRYKLCKRCKQLYAASSSYNTAESCRFHPSFFVCRRHDDQKRYYELGPNDPPYAAKFYDCCGAEDVNAPGCTTSSHISYDDE
ncbi:hypothetical protein ABFS83_06G091700 [Erythranthe nasuta]